jgi:calcineurin-like phosphoesterase family protein
MADPRTFFTADWHLGDPRIEILGRPFADTTEMTATIMANHNAAVAPDDTVYLIGDALHRECPAGPELLACFNGRVTLLRGNHDTLPDEAYLPYVERIVPEGDGIELDVDGVPCWLTHYPSRSRADRFNLVGHVHGSWRVQKAMLNVGVDCHHFRPVPAAAVPFYLNAVTDFYDQDVWVADHPANAAHADRGKPGTYFSAKP